MNHFVKTKVDKSYRIRGFRHFGSNGLEVYTVDNPFLGMASRILNQKMGTLQTGDRCRVIKKSDNYTQIKVSGVVGWVHSHTFSCSVHPVNRIIVTPVNV